MENSDQTRPGRILLLVLGMAGLLLIFLYQRTDFVGNLGAFTPGAKYIINRAIRFLLNDACMLLVIGSLFPERKYIVFAVWVQLIGLFLFLIPYFLLKLYFPHYNGPLISFLHRLVVNPVLLFLLVPAFFYQRRIVSSKSE